MKIVVFAFFISLVPVLTFGQSQRILDLEALITDRRNIAYVKNKITLAEWYTEEGFYEKAMESAEEAYDAAKRLNSKPFMALALNREAKAQWKMGGKRSHTKAANTFKRSMTLLKGTQAKDLVVDNLQQLLAMAKALGNLGEAAKIDQQLLFIQGKSVAKVLEENEELSAAYDSLTVQIDSIGTEKEMLDSELATKKAQMALMTQAQIEAELLIAQQKNLVDSLKYSNIIDSIRYQQQQLLLEQTELELKEQEAQNQLQRAQQYLLLALAAIVGLIAFSLYSRNRSIKHYNQLLEAKNEMITEEKKRSEELLLNILPAAVAEELKNQGYSQTRNYEQASVLFADFKGFSKIAKKLTPTQLVQALDECFKGFDRIITKYDLEKIKTIGDSYMCAGGLPKPDDGHPGNMIYAALEMQQFLDELRKKRRKAGLPFFEARIGIHTGPLIAGIVGTKKFAYDVWGDTVNVASRMESSSEVGRVNISSSTYELVKDQFKFEPRGKIIAKNMGEVEMYYVLPRNGKAAQFKKEEIQ